ncbi:hypothetical protein T01_12254, partial [Trichinella spiralis]
MKFTTPMFSISVHDFILILFICHLLADDLHLVLKNRNNYNLVYECRVYQRKQILKVNSEFANGCAPHADNCTPDSSILSKIEIKNNLKRCAAEETHRLILRFESFSFLFLILAMADISELGLVTNCCGGMSLVYEGRAYKFKFTGKQRKCWGCSKDKKGYKDAVSTNVDITAVLRQTCHMGASPVDQHLRSTEETKPIPLIYDEEASAAATVTSGYFPVFKRVQFARYNHRSKSFPRLPEHRQDLQIPDAFRTTKAGKNLLLWQSALRHIVVFAT